MLQEIQISQLLSRFQHLFGEEKGKRQRQGGGDANSRLLTSAWSPCRVQGDLSLAQSSAHEPSGLEQPWPGWGVCRNSSTVCRRIHRPKAQLLMKQNLREHHLLRQVSPGWHRSQSWSPQRKAVVVLDGLNAARCCDLTAKIVKHVESKQEWHENGFRQLYALTEWHLQAIWQLLAQSSCSGYSEVTSGEGAGSDWEPAWGSSPGSEPPPPTTSGAALCKGWFKHLCTSPHCCEPPNTTCNSSSFLREDPLYFRDFDGLHQSKILK